MRFVRIIQGDTKLGGFDDQMPFYPMDRQQTESFNPLGGPVAHHQQAVFCEQTFHVADDPAPCVHSRTLMLNQDFVCLPGFIVGVGHFRASNRSRVSLSSHANRRAPIRRRSAMVTWRGGGGERANVENAAHSRRGHRLPGCRVQQCLRHAANVSGTCRSRADRINGQGNEHDIRALAAKPHALICCVSFGTPPARSEGS